MLSFPDSHVWCVLLDQSDHNICNWIYLLIGGDGSLKCLFLSDIRHLWMPPTWSVARWTSSGFPWLTSRLTLNVSQRRLHWLRQWRKLVISCFFNHFFNLYVFYYGHCLNGQYPDCRCEKQVGEELMGQEADCPEEESITQWLRQVQGHVGKDQGLSCVNSSC